MHRLIWLWLLLPSSFGTALSSPPRGLSYNDVEKLALKRYQKNGGALHENDVSPMEGKVAVITGAAGGIGGELSKIVFRLGGTVVALDRYTVGLEELQTSLIETCYGATGEDNIENKRNRILTIPTKHEDLESVKEASEIIVSRYDQIDLLVNNAGISYSKDPMISAHGKDLAFTVNYLSHFLLTEKLLPRMSNEGRIVHVTSTYHWKVDGSELLPDPVNGIPIAYQSDAKLQSKKHVQRSYANTKLAQIWHSRSIAEALPDGVQCSSVCVCPSWAATGIAGKEGKQFLEKYAFSISNCGPGITSSINGMLRTDEELGDALNDGKSFVANSRVLNFFVGRTLLSSKFVSKILGWRDTLVDFLGALILFGQKYTHKDFIIQQTSPESHNDKEKRDKFYKWSKEEVKKWM